MLFDKNTKIRTHEGVFMNSRCLFIEYLDVIKSPYFLLALDIWQNKNIKEKPPFSFSSLRNCESGGDVVQWYYERNHQDVLRSLVDKKQLPNINFKEIEEESNRLLLNHPVYVENGIPLRFKTILDQAAGDDNLLIPDIRIWYPHENEVIRKDIEEMYPQEYIKPIFGNIMDILKKDDIAKDTTYVFSNWDYLEVLKATERLNFSSVLLAKEFLYNYAGDGEPYYDIDRLAEEYNAHIAVFVSSID